MESRCPSLESDRFKPFKETVSGKRFRRLMAGALVGVATSQPFFANQANAADDSGEEESSTGCPSEMVNVDDKFCIDRYESTLVEDSGNRQLSPYYSPDPAHASRTHEYWQQHYPQEGTMRGRKTAPPDLDSWQLNESYQPVAYSLANVIPNGYLNAMNAEAACTNARKRLCGVLEWRKACMGENETKYPYGNRYQYGKCNYERSPHPAQLMQGWKQEFKLMDPRLNMIDFQGDPFLRHTGEISTCASPWNDDAVHDMVGNLDEWGFDHRENRYVILGGSYVRDRKSLGCQARISAHAPAYRDYSLGTRCCKDLNEK